MHYDHFKPKSYLKLIKKYVFSEGEQFPLSYEVLLYICLGAAGGRSAATARQRRRHAYGTHRLLAGNTQCPTKRPEPGRGDGGVQQRADTAGRRRLNGTAAAMPDGRPSRRQRWRGPVRYPEDTVLPCTLSSVTYIYIYE